MQTVQRFKGNPILSPDSSRGFEKEAVFNISVIHDAGKGIYHGLYRAQSGQCNIRGKKLSLSTIGYCRSRDRVNFSNRKLLMKPEKEFERFGLEDPRVCFFEGDYYIFYTALSDYPPVPEAVSIAVAKTKDFKKIIYRKQVTEFNSKAMVIFPERIDGKVTCLLTVDCDKPPSKICLAQFKDIQKLTDRKFWSGWRRNIAPFTLDVLRSNEDHAEIGASPIKTQKGWLLIYSYIKNYLKTYAREFRIEALLLDSENPLKILKRTNEPIIVPEYDYEIYGNIPDIVFPSSALIHGNNLGIYYGGADNVCCLATIHIDDLFSSME